MATLLIVLLMAFNMWMVIYLTWERRTGDTTREKNGKDGGNRTAASEIVGRSRFRMPETKPQTATPAPNAATEIRSEEVDERTLPLPTKHRRTARTHTAAGYRTRSWTRCLRTDGCRT